MQYEGVSNFTPIIKLSRQVFKTNLSQENKDCSVPLGEGEKKMKRKRKDKDYLGKTNHI